MSGSLMDDAFGHHMWVTLRLLDTCLELSPEQLSAPVPEIDGSIMDTQRHVVGSDAWYLFDLTGDRHSRIEHDGMGLAELRATMERRANDWSQLLAGGVDPDAVVRETDEEDGYERDATMGVRLAQALHHGTDHRSQICTALTSLGVEPFIDAWNFGVEVGRVTEFYPQDR